MIASVSRPGGSRPRAEGARGLVRGILIGAAVLTWLAVSPEFSVVRAQDADVTREWPNTDFSRLSVDLAEVISGGPPRDGIPPLERVVRVGDTAWPLTRVGREGRISEAGVTITWVEGQASALDSAVIGEGREVGSVRVRHARGRDVAHDIPFAFAFHAFHPDGRWMLGR